jgi:hypothetical protein
VICYQIVAIILRHTKSVIRSVCAVPTRPKNEQQEKPIPVLFQLDVRALRLLASPRCHHHPTLHALHARACRPALAAAVGSGPQRSACAVVGGSISFMLARWASDDMRSFAVQPHHSAVQVPAVKETKLHYRTCKCSEGFTRAPPYIYIFNLSNV